VLDLPVLFTDGSPVESIYLNIATVSFLSGLHDSAANLEP